MRQINNGLVRDLPKILRKGGLTETGPRRVMGRWHVILPLLNFTEVQLVCQYILPIREPKTSCCSTLSSFGGIKKTRQLEGVILTKCGILCFFCIPTVHRESEKNSSFLGRGRRWGVANLEVISWWWRSRALQGRSWTWNWSAGTGSRRGGECPP